MKSFRSKRAWAVGTGWLIALFLCVGVFAQKNANAPSGSSEPKGRPIVTKIDEKRFAELIKPAGKPLLINFWATWCVPCREEFPDLVKIDAEFKGKIDFITISLDFEEDLATAVPKFLAEMKAEMPAYLLITPDETAAIAAVSKDWAGGLPFTVLFAPDGTLAYQRQGLIKHDVVTAEIEKLLSADTVTHRQIVDLPLYARPGFTFEKGVEDAGNDLAAGSPKILRYGLTPALGQTTIDTLKQKYSVTVTETGCLVPAGYENYVRGYNQTVIADRSKKYGKAFLSQVAFAQN
jgi:thiol-disulfide isomerase/thioredoxin